jgi:hypothetical protein
MLAPATEATSAVKKQQRQLELRTTSAAPKFQVVWPADCPATTGERVALLPHSSSVQMAAATTLAIPTDSSVPALASLVAFPSVAKPAEAQLGSRSQVSKFPGGFAGRATAESEQTAATQLAAPAKSTITLALATKAAATTTEGNSVQTVQVTEPTTTATSANILAATTAPAATVELTDAPTFPAAPKANAIAYSLVPVCKTEEIEKADATYERQELKMKS